MPWGDKGGDHQGPWGRPPVIRPPEGNKPEPGNEPPAHDFEEILRRAQEKFRQMFPDHHHEGAKGLLLLLAVIVTLWLATGIYFVKADEEGVVMRFGKYTRNTAPGLNYHLPYPIEAVTTPRVTAVNRVEIGYRSASGTRSAKTGDDAVSEESLMLTGDENIVNIDFEVQWKISDAPAYLFNVRDPEATVKAVAESAMREVIGKSHIASVLAEGKLQVEQDTKKLIQDTLNTYNAGIEIVTVNLLKADPPAEVIDAFRDVQTARADLETARNQAEAYRNDILPKAHGQAQQMVLEAEAYKQEVIAHAQGEASRFLAVYNQYKQARDVTKKRMYLETMEDIMPGMNKTIIDQKNGVVPYLPLSQLKAKTVEEQAK